MNKRRYAHATMLIGDAVWTARSEEQPRSSSPPKIPACAGMTPVFTGAGYEGAALLDSPLEKGGWGGFRRSGQRLRRLRIPRVLPQARKCMSSRKRGTPVFTGAAYESAGALKSKNEVHRMRVLPNKTRRSRNVFVDNSTAANPHNKRVYTGYPQFPTSFSHKLFAWRFGRRAPILPLKCACGQFCGKALERLLPFCRRFWAKAAHAVSPKVVHKVTGAVFQRFSYASMARGHWTHGGCARFPQVLLLLLLFLN